MTMTSIADRATLAREDRQFTVAPLEIREDEGTGPTFDGIASTVDTPYVVRDMFGDFTETMVYGAFDKSIAESDVRLLVNHDGLPLARTRSKTLTLSTTPHLRAVAVLDGGNPVVQEVRSAMQRGDLDQMSIGFRAIRQEWNADYTDRKILEAELSDVSVVTYPANPTTSAYMRSLIHGPAPEDADELRDAIARLSAALAEIEVPEEIDTADLDARYERLREQLVGIPR